MVGAFRQGISPSCHVALDKVGLSVYLGYTDDCLCFG
jgi:hypothetical protein